jgi:phosphoglucomutase
MGFKNVAIVPEQAEPNGHFPTVKSPNPENPEAMDLAVKLMLKNKADLAFGTDPDADRLGVVLNLETGPYYLNGNQIGTLMLHYILTQKKAKNLLPKKSLFIKTIVTSKLQDTIAKRFDVKVENTLTGFKWMAKKLKEYEDAKSDYQFIFATEESFGYLPQDRVRDKDGVHSVALCAEIALFYKLKGKNLYQALDDIYSEFGFSSEELLCLDYFGIEGAEKIKRIMTSFRNFKENTFAGEEIELVEDFLTGQTTYKKSSLTEKILVTPSDVLGFGLKGGHFVYLRPSGTEPKIKFYIMVQVTDGELQDKKQQAKLLTAKILTFIQNYCRDI